MRRFTRWALALAFVLIAAMGMTSSVLGQDPTVDEEGTFEGISVTCGGEGCQNVDGMQTYTVTFERGAYIPEKTYGQPMVVTVMSGTLAFRVQSTVVFIDS